jgi:hypothetical protein
MGKYSQAAGGTKHVRLEVPIRAYWSSPRAWHGDKVVLNVETAYLPDGTKLEIAIFEAEKEDGDEPLATLKDGLTLTNNRASVPYTIAWDKAARGKRLALRGERCEFYFEVRIASPELTGRSNLLYVHLHPHEVSS